MTSEERARLEAALRSTAAVVDVPATPALAAAVRSRLVAPSPDRVSVRAPRRRLMRGLAFAAACLIAFVGVMLFSPAAREAVADFLGVGGIRIGFGDVDESLDFDLDVGRQVSPAEARLSVDFPVRTIQHEEVGEPDAYFYADEPLGGLISAVYEASEHLPEVGDTGIGLLLTQFRGTPDLAYFKKLYEFENAVEFVTVDGANEAYWVGEVHELLYYDRTGEPGVEQARLSAPALIWESGGVTYRLESNLTKQKANEYANTVSTSK
jgi:hypothetical protein